MDRRTHLLALLALVGCRKPQQSGPVPAASVPTIPPDVTGKVHKTEAEWRAALDPDVFHILREKGTEPAFSGRYHDAHEPAVYVCAGCGQRLFDSVHKFDSGTGWPSFWQPIAKAAVAELEDRSYGMVRTEVECSRCDGHLGHVFDDGPKPTGLRYCINSLALRAVTRPLSP